MARRESDEEFDFDDYGEAEAMVRELRAQVVRLESQMDQLKAQGRETARDVLALQQLNAELSARMDAIEQWQRKYERRMKWTWALVTFSIILTLVNLFVF